MYLIVVYCHYNKRIYVVYHMYYNRYMKVLQVLLAFVALACLLYALAVFIRSRSRVNVLRDDWSQLRLRRKILRSLAVKHRIKTASSAAELIALKRLRRMKIKIRTTRSHDATTRETTLTFRKPFDYEAAKQFIELASEAANTAAHVSSFNVPTPLTEQTRITYTYKETQQHESTVTVTETYSQYSFPLSLLKDHSVERDRLIQEATTQALASASLLDQLLLTEGYSLTRSTVSASSSSMLFVYELHSLGSFESVASLAVKMDTFFKCSGSTAEIRSGQLRITVPLPKDLVPPIDVATLYQESFGKEQSNEY